MQQEIGMWVGWSLNSIIHFLSLKQRSHTHILVIFIQHLMPSKNWLWIKWSKYCFLVESWQWVFISLWQPLNTCFSWLFAFIELYGNLLEEAKPPQIGTGVIYKKDSAYWINHRPQHSFEEESPLVFPFLLIFQNVCTSIPSSGLPGDLVTCYHLYLENKKYWGRVWLCDLILVTG